MLLTDGAIETVLIFEMGLSLDPHLEASVLVESEAGRQALRALYQPYLDSARESGLRIQVGTPTFRCSPERIRAAGRPPEELKRLNELNVQFHKHLRGDQDALIAGVIGPRGDAYLPEQAPTPNQAAEYHRAQAQALAEAGADVLYAPTFPALSESLGVAEAMAGTGLPFAIGFVLGQDGRLLDGTPLDDAIGHIDSSNPPTHYLLSCIHPSLARKGLEQSPASRHRIHGLKANTSRKPTTELVALGHLESEDPELFAEELLQLAEDYNFSVVGGCCGTDAAHIAALARRLQA
jgi:S-methylmethionine-dependent homocysteine/selenocysteine methylase